MPRAGPAPATACSQSPVPAERPRRTVSPPPPAKLPGAPSSSSGSRDGSMSPNDQLAAPSAPAYPRPLHNPRSVQPLGQSVSRNFAPEVGSGCRRRSEKLRFQMIANMLLERNRVQADVRIDHLANAPGEAGGVLLAVGKQREGSGGRIRHNSIQTDVQISRSFRCSGRAGTEDKPPEHATLSWSLSLARSAA